MLTTAQVKPHTCVFCVKSMCFSKETNMNKTIILFCPMELLLQSTSSTITFERSVADHAPLQRRGPSYERRVTMLLPLIPLIGQLLRPDVREMFSLVDWSDSNLDQFLSDPLQPRF